MEEVRRDEMKEVWDTTRNSIDQFKITFEKPYKYSLWMTNVNLGLLGFYIAFLLQIKNGEPFQNKFHILMILTFIIVPIAIGVFYRFKYEVMEIYNSTKTFFKKLKIFIETVDEKFKEKKEGASIIEESGGIEEFNLSWKFIEKWSWKPIITGIFIQFSFFIIGLINVIVDLLKYILS
jgi:hypothetical protein